jgi:hypothetical protein
MKATMKQFFQVIFFGAIWAITLAAASIQSCKAAENEQSFWVNVGGVSRHFQDNGRNEVHPGLGIEYGLNSDTSVMLGYHKNSLNLKTQYVSVQYQPLHLGPLKIGVSAGIMNGYPQKKDGGFFPAVLPMITYESKTFGVNFGIIPNIPSQKVEGAFVAQLKWRLF